MATISSLSSSGRGSITSTRPGSSFRSRATTTGLGSPTSTFSASTGAASTKNPFNLTTIAAIVIPLLVVLSVLSILYKRRQRARATQMITVNHTHPALPTPKVSTPTWNQPHLHQGYPQTPGGNSTFQQRFVASPPLNTPTPPQQFPNQTPSWENPGTRYDPPFHPPPTANLAGTRTRTPPASGTGITYDQFLEEVERVPEREPSRNPYTSENQNQPPRSQNQAPNKTSYIEPSAQDRRSEAQVQNVVRDNPTIRVNKGEQLPGGSRQADLPSLSSQPSGGSSIPQQSRLDTIAPVMRDPAQVTPSSEAVRRKGDVVLEWSAAPDSTVPTGSQANPSSSHPEIQPTQPPADTPELQILRERVQRLEAALEDRGRDTNEGDEPDRPPPAYDSLPMESEVGSGPNSSSGRGGHP
ncbi:hypothetical protein NP233_g5258 [Leucocoprinus birnbaumii]|uniref:Transmembrane protein n=1 Tax=Leucocoprinus birnbaumii TaxID=56174 RepID=A0AAD5VZJ3_9AGAR|nr:hypothetical protein NP233_g5258 [Leucocoprinus birnbaumii]